MEEKILEIINQNFDGLYECPHNCAREITTHVREFIEWKDNQDIIKIYDDPKVYINLDDYKLMSLDEVYQYWLDNVKDKRDV